MAGSRLHDQRKREQRLATVVLNSATDNTVTVNYAISNGTDTADSDYTAASGTPTFASGETSKNGSIFFCGALVHTPTDAIDAVSLW